MRAEKPGLDELTRINTDYIKWLRRVGGERAVGLYYSHLEEILIKGPETGAIVELPLVELEEGSILFYPYATEYPYGPVTDPINLIFKNQGAATNVADKLKKDLVPPWRDTITYGVSCASVQYTFIDNTSHGGTAQWLQMSNSLTNCGCFRRCHIRIFDGGIDTHPRGYGNYAIASVHYEDWSVANLHIVRSWDEAQQFINDIFSTVFPFVGSKGTKSLQNPGEILQGIPHDGMGSVIELL